MAEQKNTPAAKQPAKTKALIGQADDAQIAEWKRKYDGAWSYETPDGRICYLKNVDRRVLGLATTNATDVNKGQLDSVKFAEIIVENCWLGGDDAIRDEDKYFMGLTQRIGGIVEIVSGDLKKL